MKQLSLDDVFVQTNCLSFSCSKLEKKVKKSVRKARLVYKKQWSDFLLNPLITNDCLDKLELGYVNPLVGFGVFTSHCIEKFAFVGEYVGLVRRRRLFLKSDSDYVFGYCIASKSTPWVIDAKLSGNITRFFNHSYEPNLFCSYWFDQDLCHVGFFANRYIKKGDQLTFDYGTDYWKKRPFPQSL